MVGPIEAARTYLAGAGQRPVGHMPPSLMIKEIQELRRLLGDLLAVLDQLEEVS
jgi:hypothetical protein